MNILILGLPKTATSAIYKYILNSLPDSLTYFEPSYFGTGRGEPVDFHKRITTEGRANVICKCLFHPLYNEGQPHLIEEVISLYDKVIIIDRDPRDRLISENLYHWFKGHEFWSEDDLKSYLKILAHKEENPGSIPFYKLCKKLPWEKGEKYLHDREGKTYGNLIKIRNKTCDIFSIRYEDFVNNKWQNLEAYLGFNILKPTKEDSPIDQRVIRTKRYGNWRTWFTNEDVIFFRPLYKEFLDQFYPNHDWNLLYPSNLDSSVGSKYVARIAQL